MVQGFETPVTGSLPVLRLALLPHRESPRLPVALQDGAPVAHPLSLKDLNDKVALLHRLGQWQEDDI